VALRCHECGRQADNCKCKMYQPCPSCRYDRFHVQQRKRDGIVELVCANCDHLAAEVHVVPTALVSSGGSWKP
jgi:hypothetical protein